MPCRNLPRVRLAQLPTPLEEAPRLSAALGGVRLLIKREDLSGLCSGGNKTRLLDYVMGDALERGVNAVVAAAKPQSNKLREIAAAAARLGMRAVLLLDGGRPAGAAQGNLLLLELLGAELRFLGPPDPKRDLLAEQEAVQAELEAAGHGVAVLDRRLAYGALATAAYVDAAAELLVQLEAEGVAPDFVYITAGAGMTLAGLVLGLKHLGCPARPVGVTIDRPADAVATDVVDHAGRAAELLGIETIVTEGDFDVLGGYAGPGYGIVTPAVIETIRLVARHHGLVLDPVYNGKAMTGLIDQIRRGAIALGQTVVYFDTGGAPALFAYNQALAGPCPT
jgi:1-aminocyclopropane-1-carboxylate deaminase/D-cysteine desulfhydrase-like pyridoxal-dependent ACC family enzyme